MKYKIFPDRFSKFSKYFNIYLIKEKYIEALNEILFPDKNID